MVFLKHCFEYFAISVPMVGGIGLIGLVNEMYLSFHWETQAIKLIKSSVFSVGLAWITTCREQITDFKAGSNPVKCSGEV